MKTRHPSLIVTLILGSSLAVLGGCGSKSENETPTIDLARPAKIIQAAQPRSSERAYPGRVQAAQRVALSFRVGGPVVEIHVSKGQQVRKDDVLARIDPRDYEVQVKNLEAQLAAARAQQLQAGEEYKRVRGLYEHDNASKSDFDRARLAIDVSEAQVEANEQALKAALLSLADTELRAPYSGIVADRLVEAHETVAPGQPVIRFQDVRGMEVVIDVPEREVSDITGLTPKGILVRFDAVAQDRVFRAQVKEFATESDPQTRTFPVTLQLETPPEAGLLPGMTASATWDMGNGKNRRAIVVPLAAVVSDEAGRTYLWRVDPESERVERLAVSTGELTDGGLEITSGLEAEDRIVAAGVDFLTEGQKVRPIAPDQAGEVQD